MKRLLFGALFFVGLYSGYSIARHVQSSAEAAPVPSGPPQEVLGARPEVGASEIFLAANEARPDSRAREALPDAPHPGGSRPARWPALSALAALEEQKLSKVTTALFDEEGRLSASFKTLFALTPEETDLVESAITTARQRIEAAMLQNAHTTHEGNTAVVVTVGPFDASDLSASTLDSLRKILGDERYRAFAILEEKELGIALNNYGAQRRVFTVTKTGGPGQPFQIQDQRRNAAAGMTIHATFADEQSLPLKYRWLVPKLGPLDTLGSPASRK